VRVACEEEYRRLILGLELLEVLGLKDAGTRDASDNCLICNLTGDAGNKSGKTGFWSTSGAWRQCMTKCCTSCQRGGRIIIMEDPRNKTSGHSNHCSGRADTVIMARGHTRQAITSGKAGGMKM
jgi:hypothetical protein